MTTVLYLPVNLRKQALNHACILLLAPTLSCLARLPPSPWRRRWRLVWREPCRSSAASSVQGDNIQPITPTSSRNYSLSPLARLGVLLAFGHAARGTQAASLPDSPYALLPSKSRHQMLSPHN
jgi:hypothetical protein